MTIPVSHLFALSQTDGLAVWPADHGSRTARREHTLKFVARTIQIRRAPGYVNQSGRAKVRKSTPCDFGISTARTGGGK
jgi:hypothetical protein